jgi:hypothetical protein
VAFWGPALAKIAHARRANIVLDIAMGGTSRNALRELNIPQDANDPENRKIMVLDGLHAKLYVSDSRAIVGSANASRNALGDGSDAPALLEAGVLIDRGEDSQAYDAAARLFGQYCKKAHVATHEDFERAVKVSTIVGARDGAPASANGFSVLNELLLDPVRFAGAIFIFGDAEIEAEDKTAADQAYGADFEDDKGAARRQLICATDDRELDRVLQEAAYMLMYWFGAKRGLRGYFDIVRIPFGNGMIAFYGRRQWSTVRSRLGISGSVTVAGYWENDAARAEAIAVADSDIAGDRFAIVPADTLCEMLERDFSDS